MHTIMVMGGGVALLALLVLFGKISGLGVGRMALWFVLIWLIGAAYNMWVGVSRAGYSVSDELPVFLAVFALPAVIAFGVYWLLGR